MTDYNWFLKWKDEVSGQRDEEYQKLKKTWENKCMALLDRFYPKVRPNIEFTDVSTPLSIGKEPLLKKLTF